MSKFVSTPAGLAPQFFISVSTTSEYPNISHGYHAGPVVLLRPDIYVGMGELENSLIIPNMNTATMPQSRTRPRGQRAAMVSSTSPTTLS